MKHTIYYLGNAAPKAGGEFVNAEHVAYLRSIGLRATLLLTQNYTKADQDRFPNVPFASLHEPITLQNQDILVMPEPGDHFAAFAQTPCQKVMHNQNGFYTFLGLESTAAIENYGLRSILVPSHYLKKQLQQLGLLKVPIQVIAPALPPYFCPPGVEGKEKCIAYMPRKRGLELSFLRAAFASAYPELRDYAWVAIEQMERPEVAAVLQKAAVFISTSQLEGLGLPPLEAMASGCIVAGHVGAAGKEYAHAQNGFWVYEDDPMLVLQALHDAVLCFETPPRRKALQAAGLNTARQYSHEVFAQHMCAAWLPILESVGGDYSYDASLLPRLPETTTNSINDTKLTATPSRAGNTRHAEEQPSTQTQLVGMNPTLTQALTQALTPTPALPNKMQSGRSPIQHSDINPHLQLSSHIPAEQASAAPNKKTDLGTQGNVDFSGAHFSGYRRNSTEPDPVLQARLRARQARRPSPAVESTHLPTLPSQFSHTEQDIVRFQQYAQQQQWEPALAFIQSRIDAGATAHFYYDAAGVAASNMGNIAQAEVHWSQATERYPQYSDTWAKLYRAKRTLGKTPEADFLWTYLLQTHPEQLQVQDWQQQLQRCQDPQTELALLRQAVALKVADISLYVDLGIKLVNQGLDTEAQAVLEQALADFITSKDIPPEHIAVVYSNLGTLFQRQNRHDQAAAAFWQSAQWNPKSGDGYSFALYHYCHCAQWKEAQEIEARILPMLQSENPAATETNANPIPLGIVPFALTVRPCFDANSLHQASIQYARKHYQAFENSPPLCAPGTWRTRLNRYTPLPSPASQAETALARTDRRLRIGYITQDFREHAVGFLLTEVLRQQSRPDSSIHIRLYSYGPDQDTPLRQRLRQLGHAFVDLHADNDSVAAKRIADDEVDILVDLMGYTSGARIGILAHRPCPINVSWLGFPGGLGSTRLVDYIIGDPVVTPLEQAAYYSEKLALMPHSYQPNDNTQNIGPTPSRSELGLPENGIVFCSFNQVFKITEDMFALWCKLLREVPGSVLWLKGTQAESQNNLQQAAQRHGVASERLVFAPTIDLESHLGRIQQADICLDTQPYTGHATASNILWAGVPMVTLLGNTFAGRVGASLLYAMDMPDLVTHSMEAYFELAKALALDPEKRLTVRTRLQYRRTHTPLFDSALFAHDLERLYWAMWQQQEKGVLDHITLPASATQVELAKTEASRA